MKRTSKLLKVLVATAIAAVMVIGCVACGSDSVTVPNVLSLTQSDAEKSILSSDLKVGQVTREASDTISAGSVISQEPKALSSAKKGSAVNIVISTGKAAPKDVKVPDLTGKTQADAEKALSDVGLVGVASNPEEYTGVQPGQVFKQSIAAGTTVKEGARVAFTVALAPAEVTVPNVVGMKLEDAKAAIAKANLGFDYTVAYNKDVAANTVASQSIAADSKVKAGTVVSVSVSLGAEPASNVKVPDVTTYSWTDAEKALTSAGLNARYTGDPAGVVVSQDIAAGTEVAPGSLVTVTLGGPSTMVEVPNLIGMSPTSAENATDEVGLGLDITGGQHGTVIDQWPAAGTQVVSRTTVHITVDDSEFSGE